MVTCMSINHEPRATGRARFGVEEEFLVVDPVTRAAAPGAAGILRRAREELGERVSEELTQLHVETKTDPVASVEEIYTQVAQARAVLGRCAEAEGLRVVAVGTPVVGHLIPPPIIPGDRPERGTATFRALHDEMSICALHVHVEEPDRERALMVSNHLRPYLPVLLALSGNSPYWAERDTGYASWRTMVWHRWPVAGPPPYFRSVAHYEELVATLLAAGALIDTGTIFWDIRPSTHLPTLEIRVADVPITAEDTALFAALVRALVAHVGAAVDHGDRGPVVPPELLRLAYWRCARDGLDGAAVDVTTGRLLPAVDLVRRLVDDLRPYLDAYGDLERTLAWLESAIVGGGGAARQRRAAARRGELADVVDYLIEHTAPAG
jgi:carboxylate-amine ligase